jgi:hypothetical protein
LRGKREKGGKSLSLSLFSEISRRKTGGKVCGEKDSTGGEFICLEKRDLEEDTP